jgi:hypothetical protein
MPWLYGNQPGSFIRRMRHPVESIMNKRTDEVLLQKIRELPAERQAEVEDFVEFLAAKERRQNAAQRLKAAQERLAADPLPPMSVEEVNAEIEAYRAEQRRAAGT